MHQSTAKRLLIGVGLYRPARWLTDNFINPSRRVDAQARFDLLTSLVPSNSLCFDVGANIGDYSYTMLQAGMTVVSVDPQPSCLIELRARFPRNSKITIIPKGVDENPGRATFFLSENHATSSMTKGWEGQSGRTIDIELVTLDALIEQFGVPYFLKMDIEGHETHALRGLHHEIPLISLEYHLNHTDCASKIDAVSYLSQFGQVTINMLPDGEKKFRWPEFLDFHRFRERFLEDCEAAARDRQFAYGDLFIKTA